MTIAALLAVVQSGVGSGGETDERWDAPGMANPFIPGYFADPDVIEHDGRYYLYATIDPWGGERLACWTSEDFKQWDYQELNWPTKEACTSPQSGGAMVWAPSIGKGPDGRYYLYVSVGSEIWVGVADHPLGPWKNALGDEPMIPFDYRPGYHMIDAQVFVDTDGAAYLYWGSGWDWTNGKCFAARLADDMVSFAGEVVDVTPTHYFEAPVVFREGDRYYLMYSDGVTIKDSYQIHYAVGDSPLGPFKEAENSPILTTDHSRNIVSPGHHTVLEKDGGRYMLYHRHSVPFEEGQAFRRICSDRFSVGGDGLIKFDGATHRGPELVQRSASNQVDRKTLKITASSQESELHGADAAFDANYATLWKSAPGDTSPWLQIERTEDSPLDRFELLFEYPNRSYDFEVQASSNGADWETVVRQAGDGAVGSPYVVDSPPAARFFRVNFSNVPKSEPAGLWEWRVVSGSR